MPNLLTSKYPIIALAMTYVSDFKFAIACSKVGITPTVALTSYIDRGVINHKAFVEDLLKFNRSKVTNDFILTIGENMLYNEQLFKILKAANVRLIEVIMPRYRYDIFKCKERLLELRDDGFVMLQKVVQYDTTSDRYARNGYWYPYFDGIIAKGDKAAGIVTEQSIEDIVTKVRQDYPHMFIVAAGGIGTKADVDALLNAGADAVGIGTLFAASKESNLSPDTKQKMIEAKFDHVTMLGERNALKFDHIETGDPNHLFSLKVGLRYPELGGHIYVGKGIDNVTSIRSLKEIVSDLT